MFRCGTEVYVHPEVWYIHMYRIVSVPPSATVPPSPPPLPPPPFRSTPPLDSLLRIYKKHHSLLSSSASNMYARNNKITTPLPHINANVVTKRINAGRKEGKDKRDLLQPVRTDNKRKSCGNTTQADDAETQDKAKTIPTHARTHSPLRGAP